jgi:hypothetical protein
MKMHPGIKQQWIDALESGKYPQGTGELQNTKGEFCCLGVLCDILPDELARWETKTPFDTTYNMVVTPITKTQSFTKFPYALADEIGLTRQSDLITLNDSARKSFTEIAQWIKENL